MIDQPDIDLLSLTGVGYPLGPQNYYGLRWKLASEGACYNPPNSWFCAVQNGTTTDGATAFTAWGVWGDLSINGKVQNTTVVASYDRNMEGNKSPPPAITSTKVGGGTIMQTGFWAGVSWFYSDISMVSPPHQAVKSPWEPAKPLAEMLVGFMAEADRIGPVTTNVTRVETPLLLAPDGTEALITLLDWRRTDPHAELCLEASPCVLDVVYVETIAMLSFKNVTSVEVVANGKLAPLPFQQLQKESLTDPPGAAKGSTVMQIRFTVPLQYAAIVQLKGRPL